MRTASQQGNRLKRYTVQVGLILSLGIGLTSNFSNLVSFAKPSNAGVAWAQTNADPFADQGLVYVLNQGQWEAAAILSRTTGLVGGQLVWSYRVLLLNGTGGLRSHIPADRLRTIAQAQAQGLTTQVYDLSSQAGITEMLAMHNDLRQQVGVPPLTWSTDLAASAQSWADLLLANQAFQHSPASRRRRGTIGENLHQRRAGLGMSYATPSQAVAGWINEQSFYTYQTNTCQPGRMCGHYLQMVWADTRQVGCGMARAADARREVWACHYYPGGIVLNRRPY